MKRIISLLLSAMIAFALFGCTAAPEHEATPPETTLSAAQAH